MELCVIEMETSREGSQGFEVAEGSSLKYLLGWGPTARKVSLEGKNIHLQE